MYGVERFNSINGFCTKVSAQHDHYRVIAKCRINVSTADRVSGLHDFFLFRCASFLDFLHPCVLCVCGHWQCCTSRQKEIRNNREPIGVGIINKTFHEMLQIEDVKYCWFSLKPKCFLAICWRLATAFHRPQYAVGRNHTHTHAHMMTLFAATRVPNYPLHRSQASRAAPNRLAINNNKIRPVPTAHWYSRVHLICDRTAFGCESVWKKRNP